MTAEAVEVAAPIGVRLLALVLTALAVPLVAAGWVAGAVWAVLAWAGDAVAVGFDDAMSLRGGGRR